MKQLIKCKKNLLNNKRTLDSIDKYTTKYGFLISYSNKGGVSHV